jgi:hypothetical protein
VLWASIIGLPFPNARTDSRTSLDSSTPTSPDPSNLLRRQEEVHRQLHRRRKQTCMDLPSPTQVPGLREIPRVRGRGREAVWDEGEDRQVRKRRRVHQHPVQDSPQGPRCPSPTDKSLHSSTKRSPRTVQPSSDRNGTVMLKLSAMPSSFWREAVLNATYVCNESVIGRSGMTRPILDGIAPSPRSSTSVRPDARPTHGSLATSVGSWTTLLDDVGCLPNVKAWRLGNVTARKVVISRDVRFD